MKFVKCECVIVIKISQIMGVSHSLFFILISYFIMFDTLFTEVIDSLLTAISCSHARLELWISVLTAILFIFTAANPGVLHIIVQL